MLKILLTMLVLLWSARSQSRKDYETQCDRYDNCEQCNKFDDCKYQEGRCIKCHIFDAYEEISDLRLYSLRNNSSLIQKDSLNVIKVDELENNILVSGGKDNCFKTVCDRDIFIDYESTYNVKITRSCIINEVINIVGIGNNGLKRFSNKDLTNCKSEEIEIRIKDASQIKISVYSFNHNSQFEIFISKTEYDEKDYYWLYITLATMLVILLFLAATNCKSKSEIHNKTSQSFNCRKV